MIDKTWTLFLDRDGVINKEIEGSYVLNSDDFVFYDGAVEAISKFSLIFGKIIIVTNQKCIGKGLITHDDLAIIHKNMLAKITAAGGKIDAIFYSPFLADSHPSRKPHCGMAYEAKIKFPTEIDFNKSIMVGNNLSDMKFGKAVDMKTIFLTTTKNLPNNTSDVSLIDANFDLLKNISFQGIC